VTSEYILSELEHVFETKINLPKDQIQSIIDYLRSFEIITDHSTSIDIQLRDENDIPVLAAAINSKTDILVTGDKDLLEVNNKYNIPIVDPRQFLQIIKGSK
jgi:putative PIN family toxin of toxin-antitoxin system